METTPTPITSFDIVSTTATATATPTTINRVGQLLRRHRWKILLAVAIPLIVFGLINLVLRNLKPKVELDKIQVNGPISDPFGPNSKIHVSFSLSNHNFVPIKYHYLLTELVYNGSPIATHWTPKFTQKPRSLEHIDSDFVMAYTFGPSTSLSVRVQLEHFYRVAGFLVGDYDHYITIACDVVVTQVSDQTFVASSNRCKPI